MKAIQSVCPEPVEKSEAKYHALTDAESAMDKIAAIYGLNGCQIDAVPEHEGGRNHIYTVAKNETEKYILRVSALGDRTEDDYMTETAFVHYLAENGASVADVLASVNGKFVERVEYCGKTAFVSLFAYAPGMLISDNGYRYRDGAPLSEYFYNTGKTLGKIHALSKVYRPVRRRMDYTDKYHMAYIDRLIPDAYASLKRAISVRLDAFKELPTDGKYYGLVHFDFSDGNYHINYENGDITVFDFDNCMYCWYMFDLANLWTHGVGWCQYEQDPEKRRAFMTEYFDTVLDGYRSETDLPKEMAAKLPLFIDMVLIENIVDEFECCLREGEDVDYEDIEDAAESLIGNIPWAGFFES